MISEWLIMNWKISSTSLQQDQLLVEESLFSLANGYLGVRGNFEEGYGPSMETIRGTYINAFYDVVDIHYGEKQYGYPDTQQKIVNIIDSQTIQVFVGKDEDEEEFSLFTGEVLSYDRTLHLDEGYADRIIHWRSPKGKEIRLHFKRVVSFVQRELFSIEVHIEPVNFFGQLKVVSTVDGDVTNFVDQDDPRVGSGNAKLLHTKLAETLDGHSIVVNETTNSHLQTACVTHHIHHRGERTERIGNEEVTTVIVSDLSKPFTLEKRNIFVDTRRHGEDLVDSGLEIHEGLKGVTFAQLLTEQKGYVQQFWSQADIEITGDDQVQQGMRFNLFHLLQSAGRDSISNIPAKGLSGEGYEGHYFWDTEIYMVPVFILSKPELAKQLLMYRYSILDSARDRAREMGHKQGALFPWRTIAGDECSAYYPAGTAQYHISADIAYSFIQYYLATGDEEFMAMHGAEVLFETARLWVDVGHFRHDEFRIDAVTGPDEYTALVNNNYYTNVMAKYNLTWAVKMYEKLQADSPADFDKLMGMLQLKETEPATWAKAAKQMYLPYDETLKINAQDDSFLQKEVWDFAGTPKEEYPLLLNYHPLTLYRHQVCKQPDTVLAHFLLEDEVDFETIKNSYHYYEKVTTHDSSLSTCVFSIMSAKIGDVEQAYEYFIETARLDLENIQGNTKDGLHLANMGGTWLAIIFGFAGVRIKESGLSLAPKLPSQWESYTCSLQYHGSKVTVMVRESSVKIAVTGDPVEVKMYDDIHVIEEEEPLEVAVPK